MTRWLQDPGSDLLRFISVCWGRLLLRGVYHFGDSVSWVTFVFALELRDLIDQKLARGASKNIDVAVLRLWHRYRRLRLVVWGLCLIGLVYFKFDIDPSLQEHAPHHWFWYFVTCLVNVRMFLVGIQALAYHFVCIERVVLRMAGRLWLPKGGPHKNRQLFIRYSVIVSSLRLVS